MSTQHILVSVVVEQSKPLSLAEVCQRYSVPEALLNEMIEQGFFPNLPSETKNVHLDEKALSRMESAFRLHRDLDINLPGVALALDLLEELEHMRQELNILRRHF